MDQLVDPLLNLNISTIISPPLWERNNTSPAATRTGEISPTRIDLLPGEDCKFITKTSLLTNDVTSFRDPSASLMETILREEDNINFVARGAHSYIFKYSARERTMLQNYAIQS